MKKHPIYTEKQIPVEGWYWFVPTHEGRGNLKKFVYIEDYVIENKHLHCKMYEGKYCGPIEIPEI